MKHTVVINSKPIRSGKTSIPDGALCGNGDIGLILGNSENGLRFHISKVDFWCGGEGCDDGGGIKAVGTFDFNIPGDLYKNYYAEQRMDSGEIFCRFANGSKYVEILAFVSAVSRNIFIDLRTDGEFIIDKPSFRPFYGEIGISKEYNYNGIEAFSREFNSDKLSFKTKIVAGLKELHWDDKNHRIYVISLDTNFDCEDFEYSGLEKLTAFTNDDYDNIRMQHIRWWKEFYSKSSFTVNDAELEMNWYASQYMLAVCSRNRKFPPGLYGNFITIDNVNWKGDYHLNYNYQAPFYALCSSNHVELTDCYASPLLEFVERGRRCAQDFLCCKGIFFPVGMGPKGIFSEFVSDRDKWERMFLGQKSNAIHSADIMIMRWNSTRDIEYARDVAYPYFKEIADFWEDYLVKENGKYVVLKDAIHEVPYYRDDFNPKKYKTVINDKNSLLTLGLIRMLMKCLIDMSVSLDMDADRREKWQDILNEIYEFPTFNKRFKKVFRYTSSGMAWNNTNSLCIQHVYPCGQIGLSSPPQLLKTAKNTFFINNRWQDGNGTNSIYPCAARLGVSPDMIIRNIKKLFHDRQLPNMLFSFGGGCLENNSTAANTLNEMVLQSFEGIIRIFPVWNRTLDCEYKTLRADGAFLVSAKMEGGNLIYVEITAEIDRMVVIENPYERAEVLSDGKTVIMTDKVIKIEMEAGNILKISKA